MPLATYKDLCIDAVDVPTLGRFWADALALDLGLHDDGDAKLTGATDRDAVWLNAVPEDLVSSPWKVLRNSEGGELCVFEREELSERRLMEIVVDCADPDPITTW